MARAAAPIAAALLGLAVAGGPASAAPAGLIDIEDRAPQCAKSGDRVLCLSDLSVHSAARVRAALRKARAALAASRTIPDA
jgi:hypothetical protein